jgi:hypothetical protein
MESITKNNPVLKMYIAWMAENVRSILHKKVYDLCTQFINIKKQYGTLIERPFYTHKCNTVPTFLNRLLQKRPVVFMNETDTTCLRNGQQPSPSFTEIGKETQCEPFVLEEYISYDEMQISAFLSVCVPTFFINNGTKGNRANIDDSYGFAYVSFLSLPPPGSSINPSHTQDGILVGMVGARFERPGYMEYKHCAITPGQNTIGNGYGKRDIDHSQNQDVRILHMWEDFYGLDIPIEDATPFYFPLYDEVTKNTYTYNKYIVNIGSNMYFHTQVYKLRLKYILKPFLVFSNNAASSFGKKAHVRATGLGLGVWRLDNIQIELTLVVFDELLCELLLPHVANVDICYFADGMKCGETESGHIHTGKGNGNSILFNSASINIADPIGPGKILIANYPWDSNAYPGNEYWLGMLNSSMDPAAACCSLISELQNPEINKHMSEHIVVY